MRLRGVGQSNQTRKGWQKLRRVIPWVSRIRWLICWLNQKRALATRKTEAEKHHVSIHPASVVPWGRKGEGGGLIWTAVTAAPRRTEPQREAVIGSLYGAQGEEKCFGRLRSATTRDGGMTAPLSCLAGVSRLASNTPVSCEVVVSRPS